MADNHLVIMAGGIGSRFWPMSTPAYPKQFIDIMGCGKTLIQLTADRFNGICPMENRWVVTSQKYTSIVKEQLPEIPEQNILSEPEARNTAPCIAYACWKIKQRHPEANIVVAPSDAFVLDVEEFRRCIKVALDFTQTGTAIVTLGMKPNRPETGYGYICSGEKLPDQEIHQVESFREKPDLETAKKYLAGLNSEEATMNKGLVALKEGDYVAATRDLKGYNLAVVEVLNGNYANAKAALGNDKCADADYLRAIIAVREGDCQGALNYLSAAIDQKPELAEAAANNIEFAPLFENPEFLALM